MTPCLFDIIMVMTTTVTKITVTMVTMLKLEAKAEEENPPFTLSEEFNSDTFSTFLWCDQDPPSWLARAHPPLGLVNLPIALSGN